MSIHLEFIRPCSGCRAIRLKNTPHGCLGININDPKKSRPVQMGRVAGGKSELRAKRPVCPHLRMIFSRGAIRDLLLNPTLNGTLPC